MTFRLDMLLPNVQAARVCLEKFADIRYGGGHFYAPGGKGRSVWRSVYLFTFTFILSLLKKHEKFSSRLQQ